MSNLDNNNIVNYNFLNLLDEVPEISENGDNYCLISKEELLPNNITLSCGHKFNYIPLFLEIFNQKFMVNKYKSRKGAPEYYACPYCRHQEMKILPEYNENDFHLSKIYKVNSQDPIYTLFMGSEGPAYNSIPMDGVCEFKTKTGTCCNNRVKLCHVSDKHYCSRHFSVNHKKMFGSTKFIGPFVKQIVQKEDKENKDTNATKVVKVKFTKATDAKATNTGAKATDAKATNTDANVTDVAKKATDAAKKATDAAAAKVDKAIKDMDAAAAKVDKAIKDMDDATINDTNKCQAILTSGKNKGQPCKYKQKVGDYCKCHHFWKAFNISLADEVSAYKAQVEGIQDNTSV